MSHARCACPRGGRNDTTALVTPCDASPDLGPVVLRGAGASELITAPTASRKAATNSLSTLHSLQLLPRPARREAGEPLGDTHTGLGRSGPPPNLHRGGKHDSGGRLQRQRNTNATLRHATRTQLEAFGERNATQLLRKPRTPTRPDATQERHALERRTRKRNGHSSRSVTVDNRDGNAGPGTSTPSPPLLWTTPQATDPNHKLELTMEGHSNPPDVLFAFPELDSRAKATQRRNLVDYKNISFDYGFNSGDCFDHARSPTCAE